SGDTDDEWRREVFQKEPTYHCPQWSRRSRNGKACSEYLPSHRRWNESLQKRGFYGHIRSPGARSQRETQQRNGQCVDDQQWAKERCQQKRDERLGHPWPEPRGNEASEHRADQRPYSEASPEQAIPLGSGVQNPVTVERQGCFERAIREKEDQ